MRESLRWGLLLLPVLVACSSLHESSSASELEARRSSAAPALRRTLDDLAGFAREGTPEGDLPRGIRVGSEQGKHAAEYLRGRFAAFTGPESVTFERFAFPAHHVDRGASRLAVSLTASAAPRAFAFDVFEGSGSGRVEDAVVVAVGTAKPEELLGVDLRGKVALVKRDAFYHRSSQYRNVAAAGAVAMLYTSEASGNQIQIGSVRESWEALGPIPAVTIGKADGAEIVAALQQHETRATITVDASAARATGQNVIATIPGVDPTHRIVIGAHYDTWYVGSVDNGGGVAALLALAELAAARAKTNGPPAYTLTFVAYDGEEVGLYGGYDYLRRHHDDGILAAVNLEMPSSEGEGRAEPMRGIATSKAEALDRAVTSASLGGGRFLYPFWLPFDLVASIFGGIIPTDIQGTYRAGIPALSTATDSPFYHTPADTPDKVDTDFLARAVERFDALLVALLAEPVPAFAPRDPAVWDADLAATPTKAGYAAETRIFKRTDVGARGEPVANHPVTFTPFCDDFFAGAPITVTTDAEGRARATIGAAELASPEAATCTGRRWLHVTAGEAFPLVEKVVALP